MRRILAVLAAAAVSAAACPAVSADTDPSWRRRPTPGELLAVWPRAALEKGVGGKATISCKVSLQGALYDCTVVSETPPGLGFGGAAIALTPQLLMNPPTHGGKPVAGGSVRIPINFESPGRPQLIAGGGSVISNVPWIEAPTYAQVVAAYPAKARDAKVGGHAVLDCHFDGQGRMAGCDVISEEPKGYGFGKSSKALAADFLGPRTDGGGVSLKGVSTQIPFTFALEMLTDTAPVIGKPKWVRLPDGSTVAAGFPAAAMAANVSVGRVTLLCNVGLAGRLGDCRVDRQDPDGLGFDKAAMALAKDFQVSVWTPEGLPTVGGLVRVPIRYQMGSSDPPPASPTPSGPTH